jgi:hypothetical protein
MLQKQPFGISSHMQFKLWAFNAESRFCASASASRNSASAKANFTVTMPQAQPVLFAALLRANFSHRASFSTHTNPPLPLQHHAAILDSDGSLFARSPPGLHCFSRSIAFGAIGNCKTFHFSESRAHH